MTAMGRIIEESLDLVRRSFENPGADSAFNHAEFWPMFIMTAIAETTLFFLIGFLSSSLGLYPSGYPEHKKLLWKSSAASVFTAAVSPVFGYRAMVAAHEAVGGDAPQLLNAPTNVYLWQALGVSLAHFTMDGLLMIVKSSEFIAAMRKPVYIQTMAHHGLCLLCWPVSAVYGRIGFYTAFCIFTECTNVFLNTRWVLGEMKATGPLKILVDVGFLLSFTAVRICTIPAVVYVFAVTDWATYASGGWLPTAMVPTSIIPIGLNCYWYSFIVSGVMAVLGLTAPKQREGDKKK